jgi:hypothetical protein
VNGFIEHLHTPLGTTSKYSAIADLHTLHITIAHAKPQFFLVFPSRCLVPALNNRDSSTSVLTPLPAGCTIHSWTHCSNCPGYNISARTTQKTPFFYCCGRVRCCGIVFIEPLPTNGRGADHRKHRSSIVAGVPSNGRCFQSHYLATGLYTTVC